MADSEYFGVAPTSVRDVETRYRYVTTIGQTTFAANYSIGFVDVYYNGLHLDPGSAFTAADGTSIILGTPASSGAIVLVIARAQVLYTSGWSTAPLQNFSNDTTAAAGGIPLWGTYRNGSVVMQRVV